MKRRSFLGLLATAIAAPAVRAEPATETTFRTPETHFSPFRATVIDADGRLGFIMSSGGFSADQRFKIEGDARTFKVIA